MKDGSDFQTNNAVDINQIEVTSTLLSPLFFFSLFLLALPASFYHSLLPETFSSLRFENIALLSFLLLSLCFPGSSSSITTLNASIFKGLDLWSSFSI